MNHAAEGLLQAYLDGEAAVAVAAEIEEHLAGCETCRGELDGLRAQGELVSRVLRQLDLPASPLAGEEAWWRFQASAREPARRRLGRFTVGALARAAAILLVFAGAAAAIPGSPVRQLISRLLAGPAPAVEAVGETVVAGAAGGDVAPVAGSRAEMPGVVLVPQEGRIRVLVWSALPGATIRVNLTEGNRVSVEAGRDAGDVRFRTGTGRIEVMNLGAAEAVISIPRSLPLASLDVDGRQWLFKAGDQLRLAGPVIAQARDLVVFRVGN